MPRQTFTPEATTAPRTPRFHNVGDTFQGLFLKPPVSRQKTKFGTQDLEFWDAEQTRPRMEHVYDFLLVDETPHPDHCHYCKKAKVREDEDDGTRRLYANDAQHRAIQKAFNSVNKPELYGLVTLKYVADNVAKQKSGQDAPKIYEAEFRNPTDAEVAQCDKHLGIEDDSPDVSDVPGLEDLVNSKPMTLAQMKAANL